MDDSLPCIIIIIILVIFSAFFSSAETAYTSCNRIRLKTEADDGNKKSEAILGILEKYDRLLSTILIGNNIVNIASASLATVLFTMYFQENGSWISTIVMTIIVLTFGEIIPKALAKNSPEWFSKFYLPIIKILIFIFFPISWLFEKVTGLFNKLMKNEDNNDSITEDELLTIIDEIEEEGMIKPYEKDLISSAIKFDDTEVKDIVTPRKDITAIDMEMTSEEIRKIFDESKYTRIPVYSGTVDNIIGILHEKDFYSFLLKTINEDEEFKVTRIMKPAHFVSQETKVSLIFKMFKDQGFHMAIVLDQFDSTLGLITLEDIIEELVGEIFDETDEIFDETKQLDENHYRASGKELVQDAFDIIGIEVESKDEENEIDLNQTINSWLSCVFGRIPTSGDNFIFQDEWKVKVLSATRKGAKEVEFERL